MMATPARALAATVLVAVLRDGVHLNTALRQLTPGGCVGREAALMQELCYGTLRFLPRLEFWLAQLLEHALKDRDLDIHALLLLGLYQLTEMRVPAHAALDETAEACRYLRKQWAVKLVNGVLRRFQREQTRFQSELCQHPEAYYAHPAWLMDNIRKSWPQAWQEILTANNQRPPLTLRANRRVTARAGLLQEFAAAGIGAQACRFSEDGLVLATPVNIETLPGFAAGKFSVQDQAAQLAAGLLDVQTGMQVLDACAAPGGKTCHVLEHYPDVGQVLALDKDATRIGKIHANLQRLGLAATVVAADAARPQDWWDGREFERILLDAPCSASGVIRRRPDIKARRQPQEVAAAVRLQARLLAALWPLLARGGKLLYATCSVLREENALQMQAFLAAQADAGVLQIHADWGIDATPGRQILTGESGMDGFYYAVLEKN